MTTDLDRALATALARSVEGLQDEWEEHDVPSPSGIASCRLRQWFDGRRIERTNRIPAASIKKMESGKAIEDFWRDIYERQGFEVISPLDRVPIGAHMTGEGDGLLVAKRTIKLNGTSIPKGETLLLELKDLGVWSYLSFLEKGVEEGLPEYWPQVQCYLEGYDVKRAILHGGQADASAVTFVWRRMWGQERRERCAARLELDDTGRPPPFWVEVIPRLPEEYAHWAGVAQEVQWHIDNCDKLPAALRDYDPHKLVPGEKFPCYYCGWADLCMKGEA